MKNKSTDTKIDFYAIIPHFCGNKVEQTRYDELIDEILRMSNEIVLIHKISDSDEVDLVGIV